jgi:sugar O-acyltransferase (sialic acid O-acetyltransferase NeuD family)
MEKPVIILGAEGLGKVVLEIFKSNNVVVYGFLDDNPKLHNQLIDDIPVLGSTSDKKYLAMLGEKCEVFLAYDDNVVKATIAKDLKKNQKVMPVNALHNSVSIADTAILHHGNLFNQYACIGAFSEVGNHCILHAGSIVDHSAKIGDFVQIGAGSIINSEAIIEDNVFVGSGVTVVSGVRIGSGARIGAGSVVVEHVKENVTVFGNPAKPID